MKTFCVSYDLRNKNRNYDDLTDKLKKFGGKTILESVWIIELNDSWNEDLLEEKLIQCVDSDEDGLFVAQISPYYVIINRHNP